MDARILLILEIIGTVAFSVSGAFVAIKAKLDLFGVVFIGCITAVGGGILRDILIGAVPPAIFSNLRIVLVAVGASLIAFLLAYLSKKHFDDIVVRIERVGNLFDAIGLAAFSVMGTEVAFTHGLSNNIALTVLLGMLTGVGGGMIRDVLTNTTPYIFKKHIYALASIGGALVYYFAKEWIMVEILPSIIAMAFVITIRLLAAKYRWSLPKVHLNEEKK